MMIANAKTLDVNSAVIRFAGDSGDGMQVIGERFGDSSAASGHDISTFPDFPAEIRAPIGTLPGVSAFQIHFGDNTVMTPGDAPDALIAMNPAALKVNLEDLKEKGLLIVNTDQFTKNNFKKSGYEKDPLKDDMLHSRYQVIEIPINNLIETALEDSPLKRGDKARSKNFFALGFIYWVYNRTIDTTIDWIETKWGKKLPDIAAANIKVLKAGYYFGETSEVIPNTYEVAKSTTPKGLYRKITGNEALAIGLVAASKTSDVEIVYGSYPITPASDILKYLALYKNFGVKTVQAEDEMAACGVAIGASFAGSLGVTGTSGPGICLKSEAIGYANITELPLVVINVQRGGPSTGLPTKTEQSDLLQAFYCRNGESPVVILAASSPSDCFWTAIEACRIALEYNSPVIFLSDGYIASGSEPWLIPDISEIPPFQINRVHMNDDVKVYGRDEKTLARRIAIPGTPKQEHQIGGLEKNEDGKVSYDADNHEAMSLLRAEKVARIADTLPPLKINGRKSGKVLVLGWGGTKGAIEAAVNRMHREGVKNVSSLHLRFINPLPNDLGDILKKFESILIPELNLGQLDLIIRSKYLIDTVSFGQVRGKPFTIVNIINKINELL